MDYTRGRQLQIDTENYRWGKVTRRRYPWPSKYQWVPIVRQLFCCFLFGNRCRCFVSALLFVMEMNPLEFVTLRCFDEDNVRMDGVRAYPLTWQRQVPPFE